MIYIVKDKEVIYLFELIVVFSKVIVEGFEMLFVIMFDGKVIFGIFKEEIDDDLCLMFVEGEELVILLEDVDFI